jgi:transcriptional regulator with XRE-family HTH domain
MRKRKSPPKAEKAVPRRIRAARLTMGFTLAEVARATGVNYQTVQGYETGRIAINVDRLVAIARVLGVPATFLFPQKKNTRDIRATPIPNKDEAQFITLFRRLKRRERKTLSNMLREFVQTLQGLGK